MPLVRTPARRLPLLATIAPAANNQDLQVSFRGMDSDMPNQDRRTHAAEAAEIALRSLIILPRDYPFLYFREYEGKESREILEKTWLEV
jgi:hypothetical protein